MPIPVLPAVFVAGTAARVFTALAARAGTDTAIKVTLNALRTGSIAQMVSAPRKETYKAPKYNAAGNLSGSGFGKETEDSNNGKIKKRKRITGLRRSRSALGLGRKTINRGPASIRDIKRAGKTSLRRGSKSLADFIAARYSPKAIAKYQDYAGRLRRSRRLIKQIVQIDANTFRIRQHIVKTDTEGNNPYSCTCPDFSQFSDDARNWLGSKAGPFNPCKHMMAVRDRATGGGGRWSCASGVCIESGAGPYATKAECEAALIPPPFTGGQCVGAPYRVFYNYTLRDAAPPNAIAGSGSGSKDGLGDFSGISKNSDGTFTTYTLNFRSGAQFGWSLRDDTFTIRSDELFINVVRLDGFPDDCGNLPSTCP